MNHSKRFFVPLVLVLFTLAGCSKRETVDIHGEDALALAPDIEWAVISEPYVAYRSGPGFDYHIAGHGRKGDVLQVNGRSYVRYESVNGEGRNAKTTVGYTTWYKFSDGWLDQNSVTVYDNKLKAENAAKKLK